MPKRLTPEEAAKLGLKPAASVAKKAESEKIRRDAAQSVAGPVPGKIQPGGPDQPPMGAEEAALRGYVESASYGASPKIGGAIGAVAEALGLRAGDTEIEGAGGVDVARQMQNPLERIVEAYRAERDAEKAANKKAAEDQPITYGGSGLLGAVTAPRLPGMVAPPKSATGLALLKPLVQTGTIGGAAYGAGSSDADTLLGLAGDAAIGGGVGGLTSGALGMTINKLRPLLRKGAESRAYKAMDPYQKTLEPLMSKSPAGDKMKAARDIGRLALERGMVRPFDTSANIARRAADAADETGRTIGGLIDEVQDTTKHLAAKGGIEGKPVNLAQIAQNLEAQAAKLDLDPTGSESAKALRREAAAINDAIAARIETGHPVYETLPAVEGMKKAEAAKVKPGDWATGEGSISAQAKMEHSRQYRKAVEDAIEELAGPEQKDLFKEKKKLFGDLTDIEDVASYGAGRQARNNFFSLGDRQMMQLGAEGSQSLSDAGLKALLIGLAAKLTRHRGSSTAAVALDKMAKGGALGATRGATSLTADEERRQALLRYLGSLTE